MRSRREERERERNMRRKVRGGEMNESGSTESRKG